MPQADGGSPLRLRDPYAEQRKLPPYPEVGAARQALTAAAITRRALDEAQARAASVAASLRARVARSDTVAQSPWRTVRTRTNDGGTTIAAERIPTASKRDCALTQTSYAARQAHATADTTPRARRAQARLGLASELAGTRLESDPVAHHDPANVDTQNDRRRRRDRERENPTAGANKTAALPIGHAAHQAKTAPPNNTPALDDAQRRAAALRATC